MSQVQTAPATDTPTSPDFAAVKARQRQTWASGDYALIGCTLQIVGESLCEAMDLRGGERVLDVAAGNGNASLAAARRWCDVTSTDYVPALLERGRARARADGFSIAFQEADAEQLPFGDGRFDVVMSTFGVMFAPDAARSSAEMLRVCRPGGRIGLANWTPDGFIGRLFKTVGSLVPPPAGVPSPALWGTRDYLQRLFGAGAERIDVQERTYVFRYRSVQHWLDVFRSSYGPTLKAFDTLQARGEDQALADALRELAAAANTAGDGTLVVPATYVEVVVHRA